MRVQMRSFVLVVALVFKVPFRSGLFAFFGKTETETILPLSQTIQRPDQTAIDRSFVVLDWFRPVLVWTSPKLV
jgi:hypothetical protein